MKDSLKTQSSQKHVSIEDILTTLDELTETLLNKFGKKPADKLNGDDVNDIEPF